MSASVPKNVMTELFELAEAKYGPDITSCSGLPWARCFTVVENGGKSTAVFWFNVGKTTRTVSKVLEAA